MSTGLAAPLPFDFFDYLKQEDKNKPLEDRYRLYNLRKAIKEIVPVEERIQPEPVEEDEEEVQPKTKEFLVYSKKWNRYFVNHDKVAEYLIKKLKCKTIYYKKSESVYSFDGRMQRLNLNGLKSFLKIKKKL